jgi:predicted DCC family thiol-disulfide oxidoreductase YuxK
MTNVTEETGFGWVLYDAECRFCVALARRCERALARRKFRLAPLQTEGGRAGLESGTELLSEMRVVTAEGRVFGGASAVVELSRHFWWAGWLRGVASLPIGKRALDAGYRWIAARRYCLGGGCAVNSTGASERAMVGDHGEQNPGEGRRLVGLRSCGPVARRTEAGEVARPTARQPIRWWDVLPLLGLPVIAALATWTAPAWVLMWSVAFAQFAGVKWLIWRDANPPAAGVGRALGFLMFWPGMDARRFLVPAKRETPPALREWTVAAFKAALGVFLVWGMARVVLGISPLAAGWVGMIGLVLFLHFGLFHLVSLAWRAVGVDAPPIMRAPLRATSLSDFWGRRWNLGFSVPARRLLVKPIGPRLGQGAATMVVFLVSGLLHELVVTVPARAGYGLPTAYFLAQGVAMLFERSALGRRLGLGGGWRGRCFALLFAAGPAFWLFNPIFVHRVILPFLQAIGAT